MKHEISEAIAKTYNSFDEKKKKDFQFKTLQDVSGQYLTDYIPDNWYDLTDDEKTAFLDDHVWEPFEGMDADEVWEIIENAYSCAIPC